VLYNPPLADNNELYEYIIVSMDKILLQLPGAGVIVMGDFNQFDTKRLWVRKRNPSKCRLVVASSQIWIGVYVPGYLLVKVCVICSMTSYCDLFYDIILMGLDTIIPTKIVRFHCRDKAWITPEIKSLISQRQKALSLENKTEYIKLRNKVICVIKQAKFYFYESHVSHLKNSKPKKWWSAIKKFSWLFKSSF
jgi:hypothetical protein